MPAQPLVPAEPSANGSLPTLTDDATLLAFKKGDLLVLTKKQGLLASENWTLGQNDRTGKTGLVPTACLYTIPTVTKPSAQLLVTGTLPCPQPGYPRAGWSGPRMPSREAQFRPCSPTSRGQEGHLGSPHHSCGKVRVQCQPAQLLVLSRCSTNGCSLPLPSWVCPGDKPNLSLPHLHSDPRGPKSLPAQGNHPPQPRPGSREAGMARIATWTS